MNEKKTRRGSIWKFHCAGSNRMIEFYYTVFRRRHWIFRPMNLLIEKCNKKDSAVLYSVGVVWKWDIWNGYIFQARISRMINADEMTKKYRFPIQRNKVPFSCTVSNARVANIYLQYSQSWRFDLIWQINITHFADVLLQLIKSCRKSWVQP